MQAPMSFSSPPLQASHSLPATPSAGPSKPNYSILLPSQAPSQAQPNASMMAPMAWTPAAPQPQPAAPPAWAAAPPPGFQSGLLQPSKPKPQPQLGSWGDLDPLG